MSLLFGGATSDRVNVGSGATLDNLNTGTLIFLAYPTSIADARFFQKGTFGSANSHYLTFTATPGLEFTRSRATTSLQMVAPVANFSGHATNQWGWYAAVWNTAGANGDQKLYYGTLSTAFAEPSAYTTQIVGSGTPGDNSADDAFVGNNVGATLAFTGRIARAIVYNVALTLGQLRAIQFGAAVFPGEVGFYELGWNGTGTQPDYSGNRNAGTVTGATVAVHAPARNPFGGRAMRQTYPAPAGGSSIAAKVAYYKMMGMQ